MLRNEKSIKVKENYCTSILNLKALGVMPSDPISRSSVTSKADTGAIQMPPTEQVARQTTALVCTRMHTEPSAARW